MTQLTETSGLVPTTPYDENDPVYVLHQRGKLEMVSTAPLRNRDDLSLAYTPGVARVCTTIEQHPETVYDLTWKSHVVAVVTDGSAVLGLGDIGPAASLPVMEGKAVLFKEFGGIDAVPICLSASSIADIVETVVRIAPGFGGINLEDISAPRCFEIERQLQERLDIPVFHDDQHGTAVVVLAALRNAALLTGRDPGRSPRGGLWRGSSRCGCDHDPARGRHRRHHRGRPWWGAPRGPRGHDVGQEPSRLGHQRRRQDRQPGRRPAWRRRVHRSLRWHGARGGCGRDGAGRDRLRPGQPASGDPPRRRHSARPVVATGRSDFPNQINNVLAFPGIFRGALDVRASSVTEGMKLAAAEAIAAVVADELTEGCVVPSPFDPRVAPAVAAAVSAAARRDGVARL